MITLFILASHRDERYVKALWDHLALLRRTMQAVIFVEPLYIEDLGQAKALVPVQQTPYVVIGCMSSTFLSKLLSELSVRGFVERAVGKVPLLISSCDWDRRPCPFVGKVPMAYKALAEAGRNQDRVLAEGVSRLRPLLTELAQGV